VSTAAAAPPRRVTDRVPAVALVLGGVTSLQVGAAIGRTLFDDVGPAGAVLLRSGFAALALVALWRPTLRSHGTAELRLAVGFGLVLGAMNLCIYESIARIPLGIAVTLEFVGPLGVAIAGSRRALDALWVALAAAGILLLSNGGTSDLDTLGVLFAVAAGGLWAAYIVLNARLGRAFSSGQGLAIAMTVGALVLLPVGIAGGGSRLLDPAVLAIGLGVALLSSAVPYSLEMEALRRLPTHVFGVLMSLEPAVAALAGLAVLGQGLSAREWVAIVLVVVASAGAARGARAPLPAEA
jgi:inner membrane transporter RhtA